MTTQEKITEAFNFGKNAGYNFVKIGHKPPNPFKGKLAETWDFGFQQGEIDAKEEQDNPSRG